MDEGRGRERLPDHRQRAGQLGRSCGIRSELCKRAWIRHGQDGAGMRTSDYDQVRACRP